MVADLSAFERLSPAFQFHVANTLGFQSLRPVQELTIAAVLDGCNCVVLAPTAGGKTEAAFFPLLSGMDAQGWAPPSVLYLSPITALLNNLEPRLRRYADTISRRVFKWHGGVGMTERQRFIADPADVLMTTPESLEVMLLSPNVPSRRLFAHLKAVVIDEIHAFAADDRGAHLSALLERLSRHCGQDLQRIGLSATVGNPEEILRWLQGTSLRPARLVDPPKAAQIPEVQLDYVASIPNAAKVISALHRGGKRLVFVDSRRRVEQLAEALTTTGTQTFVAHSSLSADERRLAERAFESGQNCVIVATSTLELGIDVGDLDAVLQVDAPPSVASFLQRMGRTGRRSGTTPNTTLLATTSEDLAASAALLRLWRSGYVEPVEPERSAFHVLAQQLLALSVQEGGVPISDWWSWVSGAEAFREVTDAQRTALVGKMAAEDILSAVDGRFVLGERGERLYGKRNFEALYAVFDVPRLIRVYWGPDEIGTIDALFMQTLAPGAAFYLGGRPWALQHVDWPRGVCQVLPAPHGKHVTWRGRTHLMSRRFAEAVRDVLTDEADDGPLWTRRAREEFLTAREFHAFLRDELRPLREHADRFEWYTYLGGRANNLISRLISEKLGEGVAADNFTVTVRADAARSLVAVREAIEAVSRSGAITEQDRLRLATSCARDRLSKFQPCLPDELEAIFLARRVVEVP